MKLGLESLEHRHMLTGPADDLAPIGSEDIYSIADGKYHEASTWSTGEVPGPSDNVRVAADHTVTIELDAEANIIRVDGVLTWDTGCDASLAIDSILVSPSGSYIDGTESDPVIADHDVTFVDSGPIDTTWDTRMISRGLVSQGTVSMHGDVKTSHAKATPPMAGDTVIWLEETAANWAVGDKILVAGTHMDRVKFPWEPSVSQDEIRTIVDIDYGRQITLDAPLTYDHDTPALDSLGGATPFRPDVANLTRSITITSEETEDVSRAGHIMLMNPDVQITSISIDEVGRNDRSRVSTKPDGLGGGLENPEGRYGIHFHLNGPDVKSTVTNSVVMHAPGWGFVNHGSNVDFTDNVGYHNFGAHFVAERGDEVGGMYGNFAAFNDPWQAGRRFKQLGPTDKLQGTGAASTGQGYWLQSPYVAMRDNTAASIIQDAFVFHGREVSGDPVDPPIQNVPFRGPLHGFEAYASGSGMHTGWHRPGLDIDDEVITGIEFWNIRWAGIQSRYTTGLTFSDGIIHNDQVDAWLHNPGADDNANYYGFVCNFNSANFRLKDIVFEGWKTGLQAPPTGEFIMDEVTIDATVNGVVVTPEGDNVIQGQVTPQNVVAIDSVINAPTDWLYL